MCKKVILILCVDIIRKVQDTKGHLFQLCGKWGKDLGASMVRGEEEKGLGRGNCICKSPRGLTNCGPDQNCEQSGLVELFRCERPLLVQEELRTPAGQVIFSTSPQSGVFRKNAWYVSRQCH